MATNSISTPYYTLALQDDIIEVVYANTSINLEIAKYLIASQGELSQGIQYPMLGDIRNIVGIDKAAREYLSEPNYTSASALLVNSALSTLIGNFFLKITEPKYPARLFTDREKAILWLKQYKVAPVRDIVRKATSSIEEALEGIRFLKHQIEDRDGYRLFNEVKHKEALVQALYDATWFRSEYDVNREVGNGRGVVDFKISMGSSDKTIVEFKLASNPGLKSVHEQVRVYEKANDTRSSIIVIMFFSDKEKKKLEQLGFNEDDHTIIIDARSNNKQSGSQVR